MSVPSFLEVKSPCPHLVVWRGCEHLVLLLIYFCYYVHLCPENPSPLLKPSETQVQAAAVEHGPTRHARLGRGACPPAAEAASVLAPPELGAGERAQRREDLFYGMWNHRGELVCWLSFQTLPVNTGWQGSPSEITAAKCMAPDC